MAAGGGNEFVIDLRVNTSKLPADVAQGVEAVKRELAKIGSPTTTAAQRPEFIAQAQNQLSSLQQTVSALPLGTSFRPGLQKQIDNAQARLVKAIDLNSATLEKQPFATTTKVSQADAANIKAQQAAQQRNLELTSPQRDAAIAEEARTSQLKRIDAEKQRLANAQLALGYEKVDLSAAQNLSPAQQEAKLHAERVLLEKQVNENLARQVREESRNAAENGSGQTEGSLFQRLEASISQRFGQQGKLPADYQKFSQFVESKLLTTAGFAASGGLFFTLFKGAQDVFAETRLLETQFVLLQQTLTNLGKGKEFDSIRQGIFDVGRETGVATSQLAELGVQLTGAFSSKGPEFIVAQIRSAAEIERVTGLSTSETVDSLTAINKTFGNTAREVGDTAVGLQQRFGVLSKEIITFSADLAPVAAQAGLSFKQLAAIGAAVQQQSGRSGSGLAESLGRVLGGLQDNAATILSIYQNNPKLATQQDKVAKDLAGGNTGPVLVNLIKNYKDLDKAQQNLLASALGGSRQAPVLAALFTSDAARKELNATNNDAGKLKQQFEALHDVIDQVFERLRVTATQIGVLFAEAGIVPFLKDAADAADILAQALGPVVSLVGSMTEGFKDLTGTDLVTKILGIAVAFKALQSYGVARAAGGSPVTSGLSALSLGLIGGPNTPDKPLGPPGANPHLAPTTAAAAAEKEAQSIRDNVVQFKSDFFQAFRTSLGRGNVNVATETVASGIKDKALELGSQFINGVERSLVDVAKSRTVLTAGAGIAATVAGQELGSNVLTSAGVGLGLGAFSPVLGAIAFASTLIGGWLEAGKQAQADAAALKSKYQDLFDQGKTGVGSELQKAASGKDVHSGFGSFISGTVTLAETGSIDQARNADFPGLDKTEAARAVLDKAQLDKTKFILKRILKDATNDTLKQVVPQYQVSLREVIKGALKEASDDPATLEKILLQTSGTAQAGGVDFQSIVNDYKKLNPKKGSLNQFLKSQDNSNTDQLIQTSEAEYQAGASTRAELLGQYNKVINADSLLVQSGAASKQTIAELLKIQAAKAKLFSDGLKEATDLQAQLLGFQRQDTPENITNLYVAELNNPKFTDRSDRAQALQGIFTSLDKAYNAYVNGAADAIEKLARVNQGIPIPQAARLEIIRTQIEQVIAASRSQGGLSKFAEITKQDMVGITQGIAQIATDENITIVAATRQWIEAQLQAITSLILNLLAASTKLKGTKAQVKKQLAGINAALGKLNAEAGALATADTNLGDIDPTVTATAPTDYTGSADSFASAGNDAAKEADDLAKRIAEARINILKALAGDDPIAQAIADIQAADVEAQYAKDEADQLNAQADRIRAEHEFQKAVEAITAAQVSVLKAAAGNNAAESARLDVVAAYGAIQDAEGEAAKLQATAQAITALKAYQQAVFNDTFGAVFTINEALAQFAGDAVKGALLQLQHAQDQLNFLRSQGGGAAELATAQAQVISAQAALRDAQLQEKESTIDFNLQTKQISSAQAIASYQALLSNADVLQLTVQERRDLILKIQQLKQGLNQDLQFDLPTELGLPTLYEARRLNQSGGNYQDNRNVTITLSSTDPASTQAAVNTIIDAVNAPPVVNPGRLY